MTYRKYIFSLIYLYLCGVFHVISGDQGNNLRNSTYLPTSIWANPTMQTMDTLKPDCTDEMENVNAKPVVNKDLIIDDYYVTKFGSATSYTSSQNNITKIIYGAHEYYNSSFSIDEDESRRLWINLDDHPNTSLIHLLSDSGKKPAKTVELSFDFPFYGHPIRNVTITTDGFLFTGDFAHSWLSASQYIAPLMADFDTRFSNNSRIKYADNGTFFTVQWERVVLKPKPEAGEFTFQVIIHRNGDIVFVYAVVAVERIREINSYPEVKIGLNDAYIIEGNGFPVRQKTIYPYHSIDFTNQDIKNSTVIYLRALPTCIEMDNCKDCLNRSTEFNCTWCPNLNRCSHGGIDRFRQHWLLNKCEVHNIKESGSCPAVTTNTATYDKHDTQAVHDPEEAIREGFVHHNDIPSLASSDNTAKKFVPNRQSPIELTLNTTTSTAAIFHSTLITKRNSSLENVAYSADNKTKNSSFQTTSVQPRIILRADTTLRSTTTLQPAINKMQHVTKSATNEDSVHDDNGISQFNITKTIHSAYQFYNSFSVDEATYRSYWLNEDVPIDNVRRTDEEVYRVSKADATAQSRINGVICSLLLVNLLCN